MRSKPSTEYSPLLKNLGEEEEGWCASCKEFVSEAEEVSASKTSYNEGEGKKAMVKKDAEKERVTKIEKWQARGKSKKRIRGKRWESNRMTVGLKKWQVKWKSKVKARMRKVLKKFIRVEREGDENKEMEEESKNVGELNDRQPDGR